MAALAVLAAHAPWLTTGHYDLTYWISKQQTFLGSIAVAAFFVMSGFLVTQSFLNSRSVLEYAGKRALRIFPALLVVVLLSMLVIGPVFTNLDLHSYFSNNEFYSYFLNAGFIVRYPLPGVFSDHVHPIVNGSLWTLRYEAACYVLLAVIGLMGLLDRKWLMLSVAAGILVATGLGVGSPREILSMRLKLSLGALGTVEIGPTLRLLSYFAVGSLAFVWRYQIPSDWRLGCVAVAGCATGFIAGLHDLLFPLCGGYLVLALGLARRLDFASLRGRDYSYGVYIYSFPIQQMLIATVPLGSFWLVNMLLAVPLTLACAMLSWHAIERPALVLKAPLSAVVSHLLTFRFPLASIDPRKPSDSRFESLDSP
jgi:peptidoglycan/LPS O-acetylase OafA/YrhL